jgi:transcriptional regulator, padR family
MKNSVDNIYRGVIYNIYRITIYLIAMYPNVIYRIEMHREESVFPVLKEKRRKMEDRIRKIYCPMTETGFYILYCLQRPQHGYGIGQQVKVMTGNQVVISPGTMYGTLSKMEGDGLIRFDHEEEKRKLYCMTPLGEEVLETEKKRIRRLYQNSQGEEYHE